MSSYGLEKYEDIEIVGLAHTALMLIATPDDHPLGAVFDRAEARKVYSAAERVLWKRISAFLLRPEEWQEWAADELAPVEDPGKIREFPAWDDDDEDW